MKILIKTAPISVNGLYQGRRFLTKKGKEAKDGMALEARIQNRGNKVLEGELDVSIEFYFKDRRRDIDSSLKGLLDCLTGVIWKDDRQIMSLHAKKMVDKENPRIEMVIEKI